MRVRLLVEDVATPDRRVIKAGAAEFPPVLRVSSSADVNAHTAGLLLNLRREGSFVLGDYDHDLPAGQCITVAANDWEGTLEDGDMVFSRFPVRGAVLTPIDDWPWPTFPPFDGSAGVKCRNHPDVDATHTAAMPSADKQPDGSYQDTVPLCAECAPRIAKLGWATTSFAHVAPSALDLGPVPPLDQILGDPAAMLESVHGIVEASMSGLAGLIRPRMVARFRAVLERNERLVVQSPEALDHLAGELVDEIMPPGMFGGSGGE